MNKILKKTIIIGAIAFAIYGVFILMLNVPQWTDFGEKIDSVMAYKNGYAYIQIYGGFADEDKFNEYSRKYELSNALSWLTNDETYRVVEINFYKNKIKFYSQKCGFNYAINQRVEALCKIKVTPMEYLEMKFMQMAIISNQYFTLD